MCRLLALVGSSIGSFLKYVDSFVEASRCDPYLMELLGRKNCEAHSDGWGYALVGVKDGGEVLSAHYRTTLPVYIDMGGVSSLKDTIQSTNIGVLIAHSRKLAEGSARVGNTHPIHYGWKGFDMWLAHNGVMDSDILSKELAMSKLPDTTDTYYLGEYVYRHLSNVDSRDLIDALKNVARFTKSAMNTLILLYSGRKLVFSVTFYLSEDRLRNPRTVNYYRVLAKKSGNSYAFFSSSLARYLQDNGIVELPPQAAVVMELDLDSEQVIQTTHTLA